MFTNNKPDALDKLSRRMLEQGQKEMQAKRMVNESLGINDKSQLPREHLKDWNKRFDEALKSLTEGVESKPENLQELSNEKLKSYVGAASKNAIEKSREEGEWSELARQNSKVPYFNRKANDSHQKVAKRSKGIDLALKKIVSEERPDDKLVPESFDDKSDWKSKEKYVAKKLTPKAKEARDKAAISEEKRTDTYLGTFRMKDGDIHPDDKARYQGVVDMIRLHRKLHALNNTPTHTDPESEVSVRRRYRGSRKDDGYSRRAYSRQSMKLKSGATHFDAYKLKEENLQEMTANKIGNYIKKATQDVDAKSFTMGMGWTTDPKKEVSVQDKKIESRKKFINKATDKLVNKAIKESLEKNAGISDSKVNKELKVGFTWVNGKGQASTGKAETNAEIPAQDQKMPETGSKQINPAVMESVILEILTNKPDMMYSDTIMESAFGDAFRAARQSGKTTFEFGGKSFNTRQAGESETQWAANMAAQQKRGADVAAQPAPVPRPRPVTPTNTPVVATPPVRPVGNMPPSRPEPVVAKPSLAQVSQNAMQQTRVSAADRGLEQPTPAPINNINVNDRVSAAAQPTLSPELAAKFMKTSPNKPQGLQEMIAPKESSLIEKILAKPAINLGEGLFQEQDALNAL